MSLVEQELLTLPEHLRSSQVFSGVRVTRSLDLCVCFVDCCLSICTFFSFGHCVVCSSSIYGFWLPLWYLQTLLKDNGKFAHFLFRTYTVNLYSLNTSFRCFHWYLQTTKVSAPRKTKDITSNFKIDEIESQRISYFPLTHDKPTPTTISETSVCHDYVSTFKSGCVKGTVHSS